MATTESVFKPQQTSIFMVTLSLVVTTVIVVTIHIVVMTIVIVTTTILVEVY